MKVSKHFDNDDDDPGGGGEHQAMNNHTGGHVVGARVIAKRLHFQHVMEHSLSSPAQKTTGVPKEESRKMIAMTIVPVHL